MKYLITICLLVAGTICFSQKNQAGTILEINPNGPDFTQERLRYNSTVKFRITNVNPFKLEGTNSTSKESVSFEVPAQFSQLSAPAKVPETPDHGVKAGETLEEIYAVGNFDPSAFQKDKQVPGFVSKLLERRGEKKELPDNKIRQLAILQMRYDILVKLQQQQDSITALKNLFIDNYNGFVTTLHKIALYTSVHGYIDSLLRESFIIDTATLKSNLESYMVSINDEDHDINKIRNKGLKAFGLVDNYYIRAKGAYDDLAKKIKNEKVNFKGVLNDEEKTVKLNIDSLYLTLVREKIFEKEFQFLTSIYDSIRSSNKRTVIINKINSGVDYYNTVKFTKFEVYTDAQQLNEDKVTITPKLKNSKGDIIKEYNPVEIKTYGGWKVDFSTGYLLSFRGDENYTNLYDSSGVTGVQKNKTDNLKHAIGAFFNAYPRTGRDINVGVSFGISLPTDGTSVGFYGGISALMLEKNRLVISMGVAGNKVNELNTGNLTKDHSAEKVSGKETYKFSNKDYREINYNYVYRPSFFVGISYNIFTVKK